MVALGQYRRLLHRCGHPLTESTAADAEGRYVVGPPTRCHACTAIEIAQAEDRPHPGALLWQAERR